jgi:hypothetical protein
MPKTVDVVFFDIGLVFVGDFCLYITCLRLIKNLTPLGGKECGPEKIMFGKLQGRDGPEGSNKKFAKTVYILGIFQVFARLSC